MTAQAARCAFLTLALLSLLGAKPTVTHVLGWETTVTGVTQWVLQQCDNTRACRMHDVASYDGASRMAEVAGLERTKSYCWRLRPIVPGQTPPLSNIVCV